MIKLINIDNPKITIVAPDKLIKEVSGNCWQLGGTQPLTFPEHLWRIEVEQEPQELDEAAKQYADGPEATWHSVTALETAFKAGAKWQAEQGDIVETEPYFCDEEGNAEITAGTSFKPHEKVIVQIRKKED